MLSEDKKRRFDVLRTIPPFAAKDHRRLLDASGKPSWLSKKSRNERRRIEKDAKKLAGKYTKILHQLSASGAGYPVDKLIRELAIEYTHRYASSGVENQPVSFNYFESFCEIRLIPKSFAPYVGLTPETDHLFNITDFFDYVTASDTGDFDISNLAALPEGQTLHFTTNGDIMDLRFMNAEDREFVVSGFTMIRRGDSLHWYLLGGQVCSAAEWQVKISETPLVELENISPSKRAFLKDSLEEKDYQIGAPLPLEGTERAAKTIAVGEMDLNTKKHLERCVLYETENSFSVYCDDPEVLKEVKYKDKINETIDNMMGHIERSSVLWDLAETFFRLPDYFIHKVALKKEVLVASGKKKPATPKGGRGIQSNYKRVASIEVVDSDVPPIRSIVPPLYGIEIEGHWVRIADGKTGVDRNGNEVTGRTWVEKSNPWRARKSKHRTIFVKNSISTAKLKVEEYQEAADKISSIPEEKAQSKPSGVGELYVMRCAAMEDQVYKVGWTSKTSQDRAAQLSTATGVPSSFVVVQSWTHPDAEALETEVHMMLDPYRVNDRREFFEVDFDVIKNAIETVLERASQYK